MSPPSSRSAVVRKVGPRQWIVELLSPVPQGFPADHGVKMRGAWFVELYMEFETWDEAVAKAVEWKVGGKVEHIVYDDRDKED